MQDAAGTRNAEESFQVAGMIPHHGGDTVTRPQTEFGQCRGEAAGASVEFTITSAQDGLVRLAGNDFNARENLSGTLQDGGQRQREIHHRAAHRALPGGGKLGRMLPLNYGEGERREGMRLPESGQFLLQSGLISETMQQTAEATVSRLRRPGQPGCPQRIAVSSARSATR